MEARLVAEEGKLVRTSCSPGRVNGPSPAENRYYVIVLFDISDAKKYRLLTKVLKGYGTRIQKSVFEAQLKRSQIKTLIASVEKLMSSRRFFNPDDNIRIYEIAGHCDLTIFGECHIDVIEDNIFV